jgi:hypothetical protein
LLIKELKKSAFTIGNVLHEGKLVNLVEYYAMKAYGGIELWLHHF